MLFRELPQANGPTGPNPNGPPGLDDTSSKGSALVKRFNGNLQMPSGAGSLGWLAASPTKCIKHALIQVMLINSQDKFNIVQAMRRSIGAASAYSRRLKVTKTKVSRSECLMLMSSIAPYLHGTARYATFDSIFEPV